MKTNREEWTSFTPDDSLFMRWNQLCFVYSLRCQIRSTSDTHTGHPQRISQSPPIQPSLTAPPFHAGKFSERDMPDYSGRDWKERAFTIGIGGPVGSGKTALLLALCRALRDEFNIGASDGKTVS